MEILIYIANGLYLASYVVQDMLRLRLLTLIAATCLMTYFYTRPEPLLTVVCWNAVFVALNLIQVARIVAKRQPRRWRAPSRRRAISKRPRRVYVLGRL